MRTLPIFPISLESRLSLGEQLVDALHQAAMQFVDSRVKLGSSEGFKTSVLLTFGSRRGINLANIFQERNQFGRDALEFANLLLKIWYLFRSHRKLYR